MRTARILLVEDERIIAAGMRQRLTRMGHTVLATVASGEDAIAQTPALSPTLVLMDIKLEGAMDGVEAGEYIHAHWGIPVIYMTTYPDAWRAQYDASWLYVRKPFDGDTLQAVLETALSRPESARG
jgi:DNA-binding NtrC family response regulator